MKKSAITRVVSKAYENSKSLAAYVFNQDVANEYSRGGVRFLKESNGYGYRYVAQNPENFPFVEYSLSINDDVTTIQNMFEVTIPGGVFHEGDTFSLTFTFSGSTTPFSHTLNIDNQPTLANVISRYNNQSSTSPVTVTFTFTMTDSCTLSVNNPASYVKNNGNIAQPVNALAPITLRISGQYTGATTGRTMNVSGISWSYTPANVTEIPAPYTGYRLPDKQPFRNDSFWNVPLNNSGSGVAPVYETSTGPMTKVIRDKWAGLSTKSGNPSITQYTSTYDPAWIPIVEISENDPQQMWSFSPNTSSSVGMVRFANYPLNIVNQTQKIFRFQSPEGPLPTGQVGDKVVMLITPDKRWCIEVGNYSYNATTKVHSGLVRFIDLYGYGYTNKWFPMLSTNVISSNLLSSGYGYQMNGFRASGFPLMSGLIRKHELDNGEIPHMLTMLIANVQCMASVFSIVSASANTFVVTAFTRMNTPTSSAVTLTECDYTSILTAGKIIFYAGNTYTITGTPTYNSTNARTTFTVSTTITGTDTTCNFGTVKYTTASEQEFTSNIVWPATERDGYAIAPQAGYGLNIPMGQVFAIPPTVDINTLGLSPEGVIVARAFQKYGGIVTDTAAFTNILCQSSADITVQQGINIRNDSERIAAQLVAVTNFGPALVQSAISTTALAKPDPILPIY